MSLVDRPPRGVLSPLRYPGGKSWLIPLVDAWLDYLSTSRKNSFIEPYAGGANIGLAMLERGRIGRLTMVELDLCVASLWKVVLDDPDWLIDRIQTFKITRSNLIGHLAKNFPATSFKEIGFQTLLRNRTSRGGVIANGGGLLRQGENGKGIFSRWYPDTLTARVNRIRKLRPHIEFIQGDGASIINGRRNRSTDVFFIDPPYSYSPNGAGSRLYTHHEIDHAGLFRLSSRIKGRFLITYDHSNHVAALAKQFSLKLKLVKMRNTHHQSKQEALISNNLSWMPK